MNTKQQELLRLLERADDRAILEFIAMEIAIMSDSLNRLKSSVAALVLAATNDLADIKSKIDSLNAGDDSVDLDALSSQIDGVTSSLNQLDQSIQQAPTDPNPPAGDPGTGGDAGAGTGDDSQGAESQA